MLVTADCQGLTQRSGDKPPRVTEKWDQLFQGSNGQLATAMLHMSAGEEARSLRCHPCSPGGLWWWLGNCGQPKPKEKRTRGIKGVFLNYTWSHQTVALSGKTTMWQLHSGACDRQHYIPDSTIYPERDRSPSTLFFPPCLISYLGFHVAQSLCDYKCVAGLLHMVLRTEEGPWTWQASTTNWTIIPV